LIALLLLILSCSVSRADPLPYTTRTHPYTGWNTTVSGDVRTVGMAGATVGLADTFLAAADNPGGLAMTLKDADANFSSNKIADRHVQNPDYPITTGDIGVAATFYPWAVSLGYVTPSREGQPYSITGFPGQADVTVTTREFRLGVARVFADNRFSLGLSLNIGQGEEEIEFVNGGPDSVEHAYTLGATFGSMYRLPNHLLLGASYTLPVTYHFDRPSGSNIPPVSGFYQSILVPERFALGLGWIPNRYARTDVSLFVVGRSPGAALLGDEQSPIGDHVSVQPRLGGAYIFADYKNVRGTLFAGTYYEMNRIDDAGSRLHATAGVEVQPWIFTLGFGMDVAEQYSNFIYSIGVDIVRVLMKGRIVPKPYQPPHQGMFPSPVHLSDAGLPRPLVKDWQPKGPDMNPIKIIEKIPERTKKEVKVLKKKLKKKEKKKKKKQPGSGDSRSSP
jgi:hypothetical protein